MEQNTHLLSKIAFSDVRALNVIRMVHHMDFSNVTSLRLLHFFKSFLITFSLRLNQISLLNEIIFNISFLKASLPVVGASKVKVSGYQGASDSRIYTLK